MYIYLCMELVFMFVGARRIVKNKNILTQFFALDCTPTQENYLIQKAVKRAQLANN